MASEHGHGAHERTRSSDRDALVDRARRTADRRPASIGGAARAGRYRQVPRRRTRPGRAGRGVVVGGRAPSVRRRSATAPRLRGIAAPAPARCPAGHRRVRARPAVAPGTRRTGVADRGQHRRRRDARPEVGCDHRRARALRRHHGARHRAQRPRRRPRRGSPPDRRTARPRGVDHRRPPRRRGAHGAAGGMGRIRRGRVAPSVGGDERGESARAS